MHDIAPHRSALSAGLRCLPSKPFVHASFAMESHCDVQKAVEPAESARCFGRPDCDERRARNRIAIGRIQTGIRACPRLSLSPQSKLHARLALRQLTGIQKKRTDNLIRFYEPKGIVGFTEGERPRIRGNSITVVFKFQKIVGGDDLGQIPGHPSALPPKTGCYSARAFHPQTGTTSMGWHADQRPTARPNNTLLPKKWDQRISLIALRWIREEVHGHATRTRNHFVKH